MKILNSLTEELKQKAVNLEGMGINSYAWSLRDTSQILEVIGREHSELIVLGGDVLLREADSIKFTYAMWSYDPVDFNDHERSVRMAREYLEQFQTRPNADNILVDLVVSTKEGIAETARNFQ